MLLLNINFFAKGDLLEKVSLSIADHFSFQIHQASNTLQSRLQKWMEAYLDRVPILWSEIPKSTLFQQNVLAALSTIPFGKTISYGDLAKNLGKEKSARAVGNACGKNPIPLLIPCHRVIRSNGNMGGFSSHVEVKKRLLGFEASFKEQL